jgi:hypothetical protein
MGGRRKPAVEKRFIGGIMRQHVTVLGIVFIVLGAMGLIGAFVVLMIFGGAAGIVGVVAQEEPEAAIAIPIVGVVGLGISFIIVVMSAPNIIAGIGLVKFRPWARILGIVVSILGLMNIPIGTLVGAYGLWVLLSGETEALFRGEPAKVDSEPEPEKVEG